MNIEYKTLQNTFDTFLKNNRNKKILIVFDINTEKYFIKYKSFFDNVSNNINTLKFDDNHLIPNERAYNSILSNAKDLDYILAIGSGTLNDLAKLVSTNLNISCGVLATAPSMDGYASTGAAVIQKGFKVSLYSNAPKDILIDLGILNEAPKKMIGAGFGDIIGKYTSLMDWQLSHLLNDELINEKSFKMMNEALIECVNNYEGIINNDLSSLEKLINALIISGLAIKENGNSRPASGSEHHFSHYLEMDFINKKKEVPLHGIQVAIGSLVSLSMYEYLNTLELDIKNISKIKKLINNLPKPIYIENMLKGLKIPYKFSQIGVDLETMNKMLLNAFKVRDRFTIHTLLNKLDLLNNIKEDLINKYY